jgi:hypothetical protein
MDGHPAGGCCLAWERGRASNPKSEIRRPKEGRRPKSEKRKKGDLDWKRGNSDFGLRISFGLRTSDFGFDTLPRSHAGGFEA